MDRFDNLFELNINKTFLGNSSIAAVFNNQRKFPHLKYLKCNEAYKVTSLLFDKTLIMAKQINPAFRMD